ncbi:amidase [Nocardia sp. NPDC052254]|uniref:amidase n=1 Tax=Nocardia sp. NPDC052254 TaxID=3155681 RepID=UPI0034480AD2
MSSRLRTGATTATELVEQALARIEAVNTEINAFTYVDRAGALHQAAGLDRELHHRGVRGPLHGIPIAVKDVIDVATMPTECGSRHMAGNIAAASAPIVQQLEELGAVVLGKTVTHEFAYGPTGDCSAAGPARNPYDLTRMAGGSSGGSAAAVAAGIVALALGTDTGGSSRIPAALCGTTGFKPRYGQIGTDGVFPLAPSLDHIGFLLADPADLELISRELGLESSETPDGNGPITVGWLDPSQFGPTDPALVERCRTALSRLESDGTIRLEEARLPRPQRLQAIFEVIQSFEVAAVHETMVRDHIDLYQPDTVDRLLRARQVTSNDYAAARAELPAATAEVLELFTGSDVLATTTTPMTAPPLGQRLSTVATEPIATKNALLSMTSIWNLVGTPALSVPVGHIRQLPVGLQLVAHRSLRPLIALGTAVTCATHDPTC